MKMETNTLSAIRAYVSRETIKPLQGLCEFIDNSLSAKAKTIQIVFHKRLLEVIDDGIGTDTPEDILTPFKSKGMDCTSRYGIGAAGCAIVLSNWGRCVASSNTGKGMTKTCVMNWAAYKSTTCGDVEITQLQSSPSSYRGTTISIDMVRQLTAEQHQKCMDEIAFRYSTAIRNGISITYTAKGKTETIRAWKRPELVRSEKETLIHKQLGKIELFCGIVKPGHKNERPGFNIYWGKRILIEHESGPCAIYEASTARIYGEIILDHETFPHVNTLKDGFNNDFDPSGLYQRIAERFKDILIDAKAEGIEVHLEVLSKKAAEILNSAFGEMGDKGKEKRIKQETPSQGPKNPEKTDRKRETADKVAGVGSVTSRGKQNGFPMRFKLTSNTTLDDAFKCHYNSRLWDVQFNPSLIPKETLKPQNLAVSAIFCVAQAWAKRSEVDKKGNSFLPGFEDSSFEEVVTVMLRSLTQQKQLSLVG